MSQVPTTEESKRSHRRWKVAALFAAVVLVAILWNFVCCPLLGALIMGIGLASGESVNHTVPSPDGKITALVISDSCGAACSCRMRVDVRTSDGYFKEVYRSWDACDATLVWLSSTEFRVLDDAGGEKLIDLHQLGITR